MAAVPPPTTGAPTSQLHPDFAAQLQNHFGPIPTPYQPIVRGLKPPPGLVPPPIHPGPTMMRASSVSPHSDYGGINPSTVLPSGGGTPPGPSLFPILPGNQGRPPGGTGYNAPGNNPYDQTQPMSGLGFSPSTHDYGGAQAGAYADAGGFNIPSPGAGWAGGAPSGNTGFGQTGGGSGFGMGPGAGPTQLPTYWGPSNGQSAGYGNGWYESNGLGGFNPLGSGASIASGGWGGMSGSSDPFGFHSGGGVIHMPEPPSIFM